MKIDKDQQERMEIEARRAERFVSRSAAAREYAHWHNDAQFFATLAYQTAFISQIQFTRKLKADQAILVLMQAVRDFVSALELGYVAEGAEISNWFYRSLVVNDLSTAHFLAALPPDVWPHGDVFPRLQASFGFALLRGEEQRAREILEVLDGLCGEADELAVNAQGFSAQLRKNAYSLMFAIFKKELSSTTAHLNKRIELKPIVPLEGTRYERFQPLDLVGLGLCRLARDRGMTVTVDHPCLPLALLHD